MATVTVSLCGQEVIKMYLTSTQDFNTVKRFG